MIFAMFIIFQVLAKNQHVLNTLIIHLALVFNKPSKLFSKHYDDGNRDLKFSQNGNYGFKNLLQETKNKKYALQKL